MSDPFLSWNRRLTLPLAELDDEHHTLLQACNRLLAAFDTDDLKEVLQAFDDLNQIARAHFDAEEQTFDCLSPAERESHSGQHQRMLLALEHLQYAVLVANGPVPISGPRDFLRRWLEDHIDVADRRLAECRAKRAVRSLVRGPRDWRETASLPTLPPVGSEVQHPFQAGSNAAAAGWYREPHGRAA